MTTSALRRTLQLSPISCLKARKRLSLSPSTFLSLFCKALQQKKTCRERKMTAQAAVTGMAMAERIIRWGASGKGDRLPASRLGAQGARAHAQRPGTKASGPSLPLLRGKGDFMGHGSRGARLELLGQLREGPCVSQRSGPLLHAGVEVTPARRGGTASARCRGRHSRCSQHRSGQTRRRATRGHTGFPSAQHSTALLPSAGAQGPCSDRRLWCPGSPRDAGDADSQMAAVPRSDAPLPHLLRSSALSLRAGSPADSSFWRKALASVHAGRPSPMRAFRVGWEVTQRGVEVDKRPCLLTLPVR